MGFYESCGECYVQANRAMPIDGKWSRAANLERRHYEADILQPVDHYGGVNKKFRTLYGDRTIRKEFKKNEEVLEQLKKPI